MKWMIYFALLMAFELIANFLSGLFGYLQNILLVPIVLAMFAIANYFWLKALKKGVGLARGTVYFTVLLVISSALVSFIFYEEAINAVKILGMGLGITSIMLLSGDMKPSYK